MSDRARKAAYTALLRIEKDGAFSNLALNPLHALPQTDASFATAICMGVLERRRALDFLIGLYAKKPPERDILLLLRTGVYQIFYLDRVPDSAACNETVTIAKELFGAKRAGFLNAVLRNLCRDKTEAAAALARQSAEIRFSFADGTASLLKEQYPDRYINIMEAFCERQPLFLRVNRLKADAETLSVRLNAKRDGDLLAVYDEQAEVVRGLETGDYFVQGFGSQMAVRMLDAHPNETVLDVCACPGGKSFGAAIDMENRGRVVSTDLHGNKLSLIEKGAQKLGISIIETAARDARNPDPAWLGKADRVICDVPCSGLGVIGSKPEIRYKDPKEFEGLYPTQRKILEASSRYLKAGGTLVYSTCTLNRAENGAVVQDFLERHNGFELEEEHTWLPCDGAGEGFYAAKLVKRK